MLILAMANVAKAEGTPPVLSFQKPGCCDSNVIVKSGHTGAITLILV